MLKQLNTNGILPKTHYRRPIKNIPKQAEWPCTSIKSHKLNKCHSQTSNTYFTVTLMRYSYTISSWKSLVLIINSVLGAPMLSHKIHNLAQLYHWLNVIFQYMHFSELQLQQTFKPLRGKLTCSNSLQIAQFCGKAANLATLLLKPLGDRDGFNG